MHVFLFGTMVHHTYESPHPGRLWTMWLPRRVRRGKMRECESVRDRGEREGGREKRAKRRDGQASAEKDFDGLRAYNLPQKSPWFNMQRKDCVANPPSPGKLST